MVQSTANATKGLTKALLDEAVPYAKTIIDGLNASQSQFHAVSYCADQLRKNGFTEVKETDKWKLEPGKGYFFTRNGSTICAFLAGNKVGKEPIHSFKIVGCHTDSPVLKVAPFSKKEFLGYNQVNVMTYGGGLWRTWFDRDLNLAGKVVIRTGEQRQNLESRLWASGRPLLSIPSLCIHLDTERDVFKINKETHLKPIMATAVINGIFGEGVEPIDDDKFKVEDRHLATLTDLIAKDLGIERGQIVDFELNLCDSQPACLRGLHDEFVSSPRLDNLASSICALDAIIQHARAPATSRDHAEIDMIMLFDHEEVGSQSAQGADSNMLVEVSQRLYKSLGGQGDEEDYFRCMRRSLLLSADLAHAVHPNYSEKHQPAHAPKIHEGIVLKVNANQRYMTDIVGSSILKVIAEKAGVPLQEFIIRNDSLCGSTIGPMMAAKAGIKTIDIGAACLSMHSIRETCGVVDLLYYQKLFAVFFTNYTELSETLLSE